MKHNSAIGLIEQLDRIKAGLDVFARPESKRAFLKALEDIVLRLNTIRAHLTDPEVDAKLSGIRQPLEQVVSLLEFAKSDELLSVLLADALSAKIARPKRVPIKVLANLSNDEIRKLLDQDLSKDELKAIAKQRGISTGKSSEKDVIIELRRTLERQEGYERLASTPSTPG